jgi:hypothetical protein
MVTLASATALGMLAIAVAGWEIVRWLRGGDALALNVWPLLIPFWLGLFIVLTLRRKRSVRFVAIAITLVCSGLFTIMSVVMALGPGIADRWIAVAMLCTFTALLALIGLPLLRPAARAWLCK